MTIAIRRAAEMNLSLVRTPSSFTLELSVQQTDPPSELPYLGSVGGLSAFDEGGNHAADIALMLEVLRADTLGHLEMYEHGSVIVLALVDTGNLVEMASLPSQRRNQGNIDLIGQPEGFGYFALLMLDADHVNTHVCRSEHHQVVVVPLTNPQGGLASWPTQQLSCSPRVAGTQ